MSLEKNLILNKYILDIFGFTTFKEVSELYKDLSSSKNPDGSSNILGKLLGRENIDVEYDELMSFDKIILEYEGKIRKARSDPKFELKYFQYFAILFTEYFLNKLSSNKTDLINSLNEFSKEYCLQESISPYLEFSDPDLRKLAFWMATGSGKTLIMHINLWQILKYFPDEWDNIILITPNERLSKQHYNEMRLSGIEADLYNGSEESLKTKNNEVLIIEITKLTSEKTGEGVSIDVSYFSGSKNLILIDEGHKGQKSEEQTWKKLREELGKDGFILEYSATFGQILNTQRALLLEEYSKAIIFDYSYYYFYSDGYGKDFYTFNIDYRNQYSDEDVQLILTASLLSYYQQLEVYEKNKHLAKEFEIEEPLWIFVGSKVLGKITTQVDEKNLSDILQIVTYLKNILLNPNSINKYKNKILSGNTGLKNLYGEDIFKDKFEYLKNNDPGIQLIFQKVFNGNGTLELYIIKKTNDEIGLKTSLSQEYFGVINIGDVPSFKKKVNEFHSDLEIKDNDIHASLFDNINKPDSKIKLLIGAKKFIEGWNSWRVSNMGLLNIGKSEGSQIIQLFGRGVRLKGKNRSLKREENPDVKLKILQTLSIFGLNADYMDSFLKSLPPELEKYIEYEIPIEFNRESDWKKNIYTIKKDEKFNFKDEVVFLEYLSHIAKKININLLSRINTGQGLNIQQAQTIQNNVLNIFKNLQYFNLLNWNELMLKINTFILARGYFNLIINDKVLKDVLIKDEFKLLLTIDQLPKDFTIRNRLMNIAEQILKEYVYKFYSFKEKEKTSEQLSFIPMVSDKSSEIYGSGKLIVKVPKSQIELLKKTIKNFNDEYYTRNINEIKAINFDKHLFYPLAVFEQGSNFENIKTIPVKLNEGETKFINDLKIYLIQKEAYLNENNIQIFVLRNISKKGLGFLIKSSTFFPDFIIWVKKKDSQEIIFVDPKGILLNFPMDKIEFCNETIKEVEKKLSKNKLKVSLKAFILSTTSYEDLENTIVGEKYKSIDELKMVNVLFQEDPGYIQGIF